MTTSTALHAVLRQISSVRSQLWRRRQLAALGFTLAAASALGGSAFAAADTWSGANSGNWNDAGNWGGGVPTSSSVATFSNNTNTTVTLATAGNAGGISFTGAGTGAFTVGTTSGPAITLASGSTISTDGTVANPEVVNAPLILAGTATFTSVGAAPADTLTIGGGITTSASSGVQALTLNGSGAGTVSGAIGNGPGAGVISVSQTAGTWTLSGANTYAGGATLTAGTLNINSSTALGTGTFTLSGGTIDNTSSGPVTLSTNNAVTLGSGFTFGGTNNLNLGTGTVTETNSTTVTITLNGTNSNLTMGGLNDNQSGTNATFTINGTGNTLTLGGMTSTRSSGGKAYIIGGSGNVTVAGAITNGTAPSGVALEYNGTGTLTLSGANTYSFANVNFGGAATELASGQLNINSSAALGTGTFAISSGGTAKIDNTSGSAITLSNNNAQTWNGGFTFIGSNNLNMGTGNIVMSNSPTVTVSGGTLTLGGAISGSSSTLNKSGAGTLILAGANTYSGATTINASGGTLQFVNEVSLYNDTTASWTPTNLVVNSGATAAFNVGGTGQFTSGDVTTLLTNIDRAVNNNGLRSGSTIGFDTTNASGGTFTVSTAIQNTTSTGGGAVGLTKLGTGTLVLGGANTYTGATAVSAGTLYISGSTGSSAITVASGAALGGTGTANGAVTINGGGAINLVDGSIGSLKVGSLTLGTGSTALSFDIGSGATNNLDSITDLGALTTNGTSNITIGFVSGTPTLTSGTYTLISGAITGTQFGTFSLADPTLGAYSLSLFDGGASGLELVVNSTVAGSNTYYYTGTTGTDFTDFHNYNTTASGGTQQTAALSSTSDVFIGATSPTPSNIAPTVGTNSVTINSLTFASSGAGGSLNGTGTVTIMGTSDGTVTDGVADSAGGSGTETLAAPVALGADQSWSVSGASDTLTDTGGIHGAHKLTLSGNGTFNFASGNSDYSGGTAVSSGAKLLITNTTGTSALGTGALTVAQGASFGGNGTAQGLASFALGSGGSGTTQVQVGSGGTDTTSKLTLAASGASTINNANLTFNLSTTTLGQANVLALGATPMSFLNGNTTLTLNLVGNNIIAADTAYVLITDSNGFQGLTTSGPNNIITGGLSIAGTSFFGASAGNNGLTTGFYNGSYLFLADGGTEIEVEVVPEPSTWAMIIGGLGVLVFWQRRRRSC